MVHFFLSLKGHFVDRRFFSDLKMVLSGCQKNCMAFVTVGFCVSDCLPFPPQGAGVRVGGDAGGGEAGAGRVLSAVHSSAGGPGAVEPLGAGVPAQPGSPQGVHREALR